MNVTASNPDDKYSQKSQSISNSLSKKPDTLTKDDSFSTLNKKWILMIKFNLI